MSDLIARLRDFDPGDDHLGLREEAATEIERLTRERDELKADLTSKDPMHMDSAGRWELAATQYAHERDRLRAALDQAFALLKQLLPCPRPWETEGDEAKLRIFTNLAREVLRGTGEKP